MRGRPDRRSGALVWIGFAILWLPSSGGLAAQSATDSVLARPVTLELKDARLSEALSRLRHDHAIPLAWSGDIIPPDHRITLAVRDEPLRSTLRTLLTGTGLGFTLTRQGTVVIVPRSDPILSVTEDSAAGDAATEMLRFATGVRQLDQIVVMGSPVAGAPQREQPTAISVLDQRDLADASSTRLGDLVRAFLPGVVLWDRGPAGPPPQYAAVRGISSFTSRGLKTYVDDIELASPELFTLVDGRSIERVEVLRGPQGAALYGPDALNGIMQIVTRKGRVSTAPSPRGSAAAGPFDRPDISNTTMWQDYSAGLSAGASASSVELGGTYSRTGASGQVPWLSLWTAQAGGETVIGPIIVSASGRAGRHEYGAERAITEGESVRSIPLALSERGVGVTLTHAVTDRWRQSLSAGHHWASGERESSTSLFLTPRLPLGASHETAWRNSIRYSSTVDAPIAGRELSVSAGAEYGRRHVERSERRFATSSDLVRLYDDNLSSTGLFGQARLRASSGLIVSGGTRAEWSSSVGQSVGTSWASTAGLAWSRPLGRSLLRLRAAWGRGIRPPEPGMSRGMAIPGLIQEPNAELEPETQSGVEVGAEFHLDDTIVLRAAWYDQTAEGLIQQVPRRTDGPERVYQFQNLGAISNRGVELEAGLRLGRLTTTGALYLNESRVEELAQRYTGIFQVGDEPPEIPAGVGAIRLRYQTGPVAAEVGGAWLGPWTGYDWEAALSTDPRPSDREYWIEYPGGFRPWIAGSYQVTPDWQLFTRIDNPGNASGTVRSNVAPPPGRYVVVGISLRP